MGEKDELDEFIVDENEPADKKILARIITPYVKSIGKNKVIDYSEEFDKAQAWKKILIYLCCKKIMHVKGIVETEEAGPTEVATQTHISLDSAKNISRDDNLKKVVIGSKGNYYIPNYRLKKVKELLLGNDYGN